MKYLAPKYEIATLEASDIITASSDKYEVKTNDDGSGSVIMNASNLFR
ncbi:MAG: hypothetical protein II980_00655 [Clostridia bacterium]|nr:hypothetical protein [Clostridia bacterium]